MVKKKTDEKPIESAEELAAAVFLEALSAIRTEIKGIADGSIKPEGHDRASRIAWLAGKATSIAAELRKAQAAADAATKKISSDTLVSWAKLQTREARARLTAAIAAIDSPTRKSVLG